MSLSTCTCTLFNLLFKVWYLPYFRGKVVDQAVLTPERVSHQRKGESLQQTSRPQPRAPPPLPQLLFKLLLEWTRTLSLGTGRSWRYWPNTWLGPTPVIAAPPHSRGRGVLSQLFIGAETWSCSREPLNTQLDYAGLWWGHSKKNFKSDHQTFGKKFFYSSFIIKIFILEFAWVPLPSDWS